MEKTVSEAIQNRRSVRIFNGNKIDSNKVKNCIYNATLAPNSSNLQLWEFIHVNDPLNLQKLSKACMNQSAAKTASQIVVVVTRRDLWKKRSKENIEFLNTQFKKNLITEKRYKHALKYYEKLIPILYFDILGLLGIIKYVTFQLIGLFIPVVRQTTKADLRVVVHKTAGLAAQNFMNSMSAIGYDTCPMEGSDTLMVKKILNIPRGAEINMVIGCGERLEKGVFGPRFRVPFEDVYRYI
ncbi:nitroreductase family protein [Flavobacteriaceae bacterium]|nr:nitroreductase family protein [Flavobacteriaceae bacterium]RCL64486.1 MAG: nitroreductase family protein [Cryomorphaceae bacterium]|tara:strand:+ start:265 stop:984 length:720 start_codon:yes stop_codon:yes gene_type:complete